MLNTWKKNKRLKFFNLCVSFVFFYILISLFSTLVLDISFGSFVVVVILHGIIFETFTFATVRIIVKYFECFTYLCICFYSSYFLFYLEWTNSTATPPSPTVQHFCKISLFGFHRPIDVLKICLKIYVMDTICSHSWKCFLANTWYVLILELSFSWKYKNNAYLLLSLHYSQGKRERCVSICYKMHKWP